jgi:hypothetical protein
MFRKPVFWVAFAVVSLLGIALAVQLFPRALPFVTLDLRMDRDIALARARELATRHGWGPDAPRQAAAFGSDDAVQAYVELEAGGNEAFARLLHSDLYSFYTWRVRLFQEHDANETLVRFTPAGEAYGFRETLPEDEPGAALEPDAARQIAEAAATDAWGVDLAPYSPLETSTETRPGGRVDHTFVYERDDVRLAEARYRLRLVVSGDRFTELTHFVKVPEAFERRFSEMRSQNELVAGISSLLTYLLYGGGAIVALFLLLRRRFVVWRPALPWAGAIAVLVGAAMLSQWPLAWMEYDTALSAAGFAAERIIFAALNGLFLGVVALVMIVAGESLTRRAFPRHPQLWRLWSARGGRSLQTLGRTWGAYLLLGPMLAYLTLLYAFAREHLGWWMPSEALTDPNVVAAYVPWLFPIAISLQAGFLEEVVFRAIPLAGAALLGQRLGGRRYWLGATLVLQAILFGAAHADYPAQPAFARLVEIAIPFLFIGLIYVVFGLLPAIVMHFAFDVLMFSLPLFASHAPGVGVDRALVILLALVPLWVVLFTRLRRGPWIQLPEALRNAGWAPPPEAEKPVDESPPVALPSLGRRTVLGLAVAGVLGAMAWATFTPFHADAPPLGIGRATAVAAAREALQRRGVTLEESWKELPSVAGDVGLADRFVWQEGGPEVYGKVIGTYIEAPHWMVRYARFEGDVVDRAEEYRLHVDSTPRVIRLQHTLPEGREGASLTADEARERAAEAIRSTLDLAPSGLREVSAEPAERPARRDWQFVYENPAVSVGDDGEARVGVSLAGDEVGDVFPHVYVPEEWRRDEEQRLRLASLAMNVCAFPVGLGLLAGAVAGLVRWSRGRFARGTSGVVFAGLAALLALRAANAWPTVFAGFDTARPWTTQAVMAGSAAFVGAGFLAALLALIAGFVHRWRPPAPPSPWWRTALVGTAVGTVWSGLGAAVSAASPSRAPVWGQLAPAGTALPWIGVTLDAVRGWMLLTLLLLLLVGLAGALSREWTRRRGLTVVVLVGAGVLLGGIRGVETLGLWVVTGLATGIVLAASWVLVLRFRAAVVPLATATMALLALFRHAVLAAYPGAQAGAALGLLTVAGLALWWARRIEADARQAQ